MMRTFILSALIAIAILNIQAQNYLISFSGSGASKTIDSIRVKNLIQQTSVKLAGDDILQLMASGVGINELSKSNDNSISIYPNPMTENCKIEFASPSAGKATIELFDITGRRVVSAEKNFNLGRNAIDLSYLSLGVFTLQIKAERYTYAGKIISNYKGTAKPEITYSEKEILNTNSHSGLKSKGNTVQMQYNEGEMLKFTAYSGNNGTVTMSAPSQSGSMDFPFMKCTDADSNNYKIVQIGTQTWMEENLNVGTMIYGYNQTNNSVTEKFCFEGSAANCDVYGGLYQWDEMMKYVGTEKTQGICPDGWHIPCNAEWSTLISYVGGYAGLCEEETSHWKYEIGNNSSGFNAIPGGFFTGNWYGNIRVLAAFWTSNWIDNTLAYGYSIHALDGMIQRDGQRIDAYSVRCIKD